MIESCDRGIIKVDAGKLLSLQVYTSRTTLGDSDGSSGERSPGERERALHVARLHRAGSRTPTMSSPSHLPHIPPPTSTSSSSAAGTPGYHIQSAPAKISGVPCPATPTRYTAPVHIDVGGTIYTSSLETLTKWVECVLKKNVYVRTMFPRILPWSQI